VFRIKRYNQGKERLLAACDDDVLGRKLHEGKLHLNVTPEFYDGFEADEQELEVQLRSCTIANLVGQRCVDVAIRLGYVERDNVIRIEGVPHAQWALFL
jgi:hypothetical protein